MEFYWKCEVSETPAGARGPAEMKKIQILNIIEKLRFRSPWPESEAEPRRKNIRFWIAEIQVSEVGAGVVGRAETQKH